MSYLVTINIFADPANPVPSITLLDIPWYAGMTALDAMILGEAMYVSSFTFRVAYRSIYGAQVDQIDGLTDNDQPSHYWILWIDGVESTAGASESMLSEGPAKTSTVVEWRYTDFAQSELGGPMAKVAPLPGEDQASGSGTG